MRIHCLQHVPFEGPALISEWIEEKGFELTFTRLYQSDPFPPVADLQWLVVMGGPMGVHDEREYPWLKEEKKYLQAAIQKGKTVIGICLGAQLIAGVLGSRVYKNKYKEIGWFPLYWTDHKNNHPAFKSLADETLALHWHGETFDLPLGAKHIAYSEACPQQGFVYGDNVIALQCHLEMTPDSARAIATHCAEELTPDTFIQSRQAILGNQLGFKQAGRAMKTLLNNLAQVR